MKQILLLLLCLILLIPTTTAISLSLIKNNQIIYEPGKNYTFDYNTGNPTSQPTTIQVKVSTNKELQDYTNTTVEQIRLNAFAVGSFQVKLTMPDKLPYGVYRITVYVQQKNENGGMSGTTGAQDSIKIISPHPEGYPYIEMTAQDTQQSKGYINYRTTAQNIGKKILGNTEVITSIYLNDKFINSTKKTLGNMQPYALTAYNDKIGITNQSGYYKLQTRIEKETRETEITVGTPKIEAAQVLTKVKANKENNITVTFNITNWDSPINATVGISLLELVSTEQQAMVHPGENTITFSKKTKEGGSGTYPGLLKINAKNIRITKDIQANVEGSPITTKKSTFKRILGGTEDAPEEQYATPEAAAEKSRSEIFLILILIASFVIFAFALGHYFAKKPREPQNEITQPTPPKTKP
ncbi:MAG: hypothetical protein NTW67_06740 [Candidatus Woesearchaeota archaeon]|nr:hypothetical protein [Candidatus Woesearchaeota archaeon]